MDAWLGYEDLKTLEASISATKAQTDKVYFAARHWVRSRLIYIREYTENTEPNIYVFLIQDIILEKTDKAYFAASQWVPGLHLCPVGAPHHLAA